MSKLFNQQGMHINLVLLKGYTILSLSNIYFFRIERKTSIIYGGVPAPLLARNTPKGGSISQSDAHQSKYKRHGPSANDLHAFSQLINEVINRQIDRQTDRQTNKQIDRQTPQKYKCHGPSANDIHAFSQLINEVRSRQIDRQIYTITVMDVQMEKQIDEYILTVQYFSNLVSLTMTLKIKINYFLNTLYFYDVHSIQLLNNLNG